MSLVVSPLNCVVQYDDDDDDPKDGNLITQEKNSFHVFAVNVGFYIPI